LSSLDRQEDELVRLVNLKRCSVAQQFKLDAHFRVVPAAAFSLQSPTQRLGSLPWIAARILDKNLVDLFMSGISHLCNP
jgi:hypothetical protein